MGLSDPLLVSPFSRGRYSLLKHPLILCDNVYPSSAENPQGLLLNREATFTTPIRDAETACDPIPLTNLYAGQVTICRRVPFEQVADLGGGYIHAAAVPQVIYGLH